MSTSWCDGAYLGLQWEAILSWRSGGVWGDGKDRDLGDGLGDDGVESLFFMPKEVFAQFSRCGQDQFEAVDQKGVICFLNSERFASASILMCLCRGRGGGSEGLQTKEY